VRPLGRILFLTGQLELVPAELIDHTAPRPTAPEPGVTVEYGRYLAQVGVLAATAPAYPAVRYPGHPPMTWLFLRQLISPQAES
jgi:hypothetical protein